MVLFVQKYDIHPDKVEAYNEWAKTAISRILAAPGVVEFRGYRPVTGASQVAVTIEFADLTAFAAFYADEGMQKLLNESRAFEINLSYELWGPSPVVPEPIRPRSS
jgi:antibiotic biosynthesis monooxygenase (ABM) superfamily enzyme